MPDKLITLIEDDDECTTCQHLRSEHTLSEAWDNDDWWWVYEECNEPGCTCPGFTEP